MVADLAPKRGLGSQARQILSASSRLEIQFWQQDVYEPTRNLDLSGLKQAAEQFSPHEILLILDSPAAAAVRQTLSCLRRCSDVPLLVIGEFRDYAQTLKLFEWGMMDFLLPPLQESDLLARVFRFLGNCGSDDDLVERLKARLGLRQMIGRSSAFRCILERIPLVAGCDANVFLCGETGTGKELCARAIHYLSERSKRSFVPVNCGAIPLELVENELFGHESAAFTGASSARPGLIREAEGGTLFLDEIDSLPLAAQVKLLRFLQEKEYRALGSTKLRKASLRIVAAANTDPREAVERGQLRQDLYYRLNVIPLSMPPLRERREDIPLLAQHFLSRFAADFDKPSLQLDRQALQKLLQHDWPGNVRELKHVLERAVVLCRRAVVQVADIDLQRRSESSCIESFQEAKARIIQQFERSYIRSLLVVCQGNISQAARMARKNRRAFWELIRKHRIDAHSFK